MAVNGNMVNSLLTPHPILIPTAANDHAPLLHSLTALLTLPSRPRINLKHVQVLMCQP